MATPAKNVPTKPQPAKPAKPQPTPDEQRKKNRAAAESILASIERTARKTARLMRKNALSEAQVKWFRDQYAAGLESLDRAIQPQGVAARAAMPEE